jgi:Rieske 2Fe-2S family protein
MPENTLPIEKLINRQKPGHALEQPFYVDPAIFEHELERVITRNWVLAGHQSELPEPGDFKVFGVADESAIIVRGSDGELNAFANVCRHRGSKVCLDRSGHVDKFMCPYHGWMYDIDGNLVAARSMDAGFDKSAYGLKRVSIDVIGGFILIAFSDDPPATDCAKRDLAEPMAMFDFDNLKVAAHKVYDIPANWKLAIENYQECYHCATAHPEYAQRHTLMVDWRKRDRLQGKMKARMQSCGLQDLEIDPLDLDVPAGQLDYGYSRTALFEGYLTGSEDGQPLAPLLGQLTGFDGGASDFSLGGFSYLLVYSDHAVAYVFTPVDMNNCKCEIYWLVRSNAEEGKDYDVDQLTWLWDVTTEADKEIIVNNWRGLQSRYYQPGPFSAMERMEKMWVEWYLQQVGRPL